MTAPMVEHVPRGQRPIRIPSNIPLGKAAPPYVVAGRAGTWRLEFPLAADVAPGAQLRLQLFHNRNSKCVFHDPSEDRVVRPDFLRVEMSSGESLSLFDVESGVVGIDVPAGGLKKGETLTVRIGEGAEIRPQPIRTLDKFFLLYVAGPDGVPPTRPSGQHQIVAACALHVLGGAIEQLRAYAPSQAAPGEKIPVLIRGEDEYGNLSCELLDEVRVCAGDERLEADVERVADSPCLRAHVRLPRAGVLRVGVREGRSGLETTTNPVVCRPGQRKTNVYWGMIHGHTEISDGTGNLDYYFRQMRDEARLDFAAPGDHDHTWETPDEFWRLTCEKVAEYNQPGRFVTLLGYEWAKWRQNGDGDRNVYYLEDHRPIYRSDEGHYPSPPDLFAALAEAQERAIVIPHHTGHTGNWCDFKDHDPIRERLIEIFQCRGSYECSAEDGNPLPEREAKPPKREGFIRRALAMGWRVGFTGGGDDHTGHAGTDFPLKEGAGDLPSYKAGLLSVQAAELTREAIWEALWNRRVVATSGPRMLLDFTLDGRPMGSELRSGDMPQLRKRRNIRVEFHGTDEIDRIDVIRNNAVVHSTSADGSDCAFDWNDETPLADALLPEAEFCDHPFAFYYVRAVQTDGETAWASPIWIDP